MPYNIDLFLDQNPQEIEDFAKQCSYLYKPESRGFSETLSTMANAISKGLIVVSDTGYMTEKDYCEHGRFRESLVLGEKYKKMQAKTIK